MRVTLPLVLGWCLLLTACPAQPTVSKLSTPPSSSASQANSGKPGAKPGIKPPTSLPAVKQLVIIYTGDTLSAMQPQVNQTPEGKTARLGGISALTAGILDYEASITAMTRQRVLDSGGVAKNVKTDAVQGLLGEHPYLLLDYGGWERGSDSAGLPYVALQQEMYAYLHYSAVASLLFENHDFEMWKAYEPLLKVPLLCSAGQTQIVQAEPIVTRTVHGALWGVVAVPLPMPRAQNVPGVYEQYINHAAQRLTEAHCDFGILLCKGAPKEVYTKLATDSRFAVVIGIAPPALAVKEGFNKVEAGGPIMLPELNWGGQEFATCHLIYPEQGDKPVQFNFVRHTCVDDLKSPLPYRKQALAAVKERQKLGGK